MSEGSVQGTTSHEKPIRNVRDYMRRYFPKEYERRVKEGRCMHCGQTLPTKRWSR